MCIFHHSFYVDGLSVRPFLLFGAPGHPKLLHQSLHLIVGVLGGFGERFFLDSSTHPADEAFPEVSGVPLGDVVHEVGPLVAIFKQ